MKHLIGYYQKVIWSTELYPKEGTKSIQFFNKTWGAEVSRADASLDIPNQLYQDMIVRKVNVHFDSDGFNKQYIATDIKRLCREGCFMFKVANIEVIRYPLTLLYSNGFTYYEDYNIFIPRNQAFHAELVFDNDTLLYNKNLITIWLDTLVRKPL